MKAIKVLLLQGGMEVIAEVEELRSPSLMAGHEGALDGYRLSKPFRILPVPVIQPTQQGININITPQMIPLMGAVMQSWIEIKPSDIIGSPMEANKAFESAYVQRTTGIALG
jgi:hypothetical protein